MRQFKSKRGIEMSINIIVMLVIGLTILGLVIGFVSNQFATIEERIGGQISEQDRQTLERIKSCSENPCVFPSPTFNVKVGQESNIFLKVRSATSDGVNVAPGPLANAFVATKELIITLTKSSGDAMDASTYSVYGPGFQVSQGGEDSQLYIFDPKTLPVGTYFARIELTELIPTSGTATATGTATLTINVE
jgi:hypothetical protein